MQRPAGVHAFAVFTVLVMCGCSDAVTSSPVDAVVPVDAALALDQGVPPDLATLPDLASSPDGGEPSELCYVATFLGGILPFHIVPQSGALDPVPGGAVDVHAQFYAVAPSPSRKFLYAVDIAGNKLHQYRIKAGGGLEPLATPTLLLEGQSFGLAIAPGGRFAYVGRDSAIAVLTLDPDGGLAAPAPLGPTVLDAPPAVLAVDPSGRFLYATQTSLFGVRGFAIDPQSGGLKEIDGSPFSKAAVFGGGIAMHPNGRFLYIAGADSFSALRIDPTSGALQDVAGSPEPIGPGQSDRQAISVAIDPQGRFVFAIATQRHKVFSWAIDPDQGTVHGAPGSPYEGGAAPYSVAVNPAGHFVYVGNDDGHSRAFKINESNGALDPTPESPFVTDGLQPEFAILRAP